MRSAMEAFKLANGLFVIPLMMAYTPLLLTGDTGWMDVLTAGLITLVMIVTLAGVLEGYLFAQAQNWLRALGLVSAALLLFPMTATRIAGLAGAVVFFTVNWLASRRAPHAP